MNRYHITHDGFRTYNLWYLPEGGYLTPVGTFPTDDAARQHSLYLAETEDAS